MRVGEPRLAARCRGVLPANVLLLTSAPSYEEKHETMRMGCHMLPPPTVCHPRLQRLLCFCQSPVGHCTPFQSYSHQTTSPLHTFFTR